MKDFSNLERGPSQKIVAIFMIQKTNVGFVSNIQYMYHLVGSLEFQTT